jgi:hypothetical protein
MKIKIPHPHFTAPKVKKSHFRRVLFISILAAVAAHEFIPAYEHIAGLAANLFFFWEPTIEV